ncbi:MAG: N-acetylneuraminate synthase family protein [Desulfofustis sp. PB-SRB1]|jgi:N,N'-diacetyllegionaminate synthase|nr:N-acetylneuraminate synthase family protein [Desulfofustis sp. PB-SRB1]MBM1001656.1 N-acetylneuraminate synthase family protein [Desulfofustis sp. PB-SRB1]HBH32838.1 N-acetylneuraminate synthase [Desulfofustis sp.]
MKIFHIKNKKIGIGHTPYVVAEVAQAHDGSLGTAHAYIDAIARTGADAVKFQTHIAEAESTQEEPWRIKFSPQDETRYDYWRRLEFSEAQWRGLYAHAQEQGMAFISSPFSIKAVDMLIETGIDAWKIASGEVATPDLIEKVVESNIPVLVSSGMSSFEEIKKVVKIFRQRDKPFSLLQCSSYYPCPPEKVGLNNLALFREEFKCPVGLSDHSGTIYPSLAAVVLGASILEVHVTFSRDLFGPDVSSSITIEELATLIKGVRFCEKMMGNPVDKDRLAKELAPMRQLFTKSVVSVRDLAAGTILTGEDVTVKKPGHGIPAKELNSVIGCRLRTDVRVDQVLLPGDIEWNSQ